MKKRNILKVAIALILVLALSVVAGVGCINSANTYAPNGAYLNGDNITPNNSTQNGIEQADANGGQGEEQSNYDGGQSETQSTAQSLKVAVKAGVLAAYPEYKVDYVEYGYLSQEYVNELYYNSLTNVYYGFNYEEVASYMQNENWVFTVDESGQTVANKVVHTNSGLLDLVKNVAIGSGVVVVCAVLTCVTVSLAAPVACFFVGAAKGAVVGGISGAAIGGAIGGAVKGVQTNSWEGALNGAASGALKGCSWGVLAGSMVGCFTF
ncbi:MAG: hypothetical protein J6B04_00810 [Clostridia bacterium]|nr:hypothetical protein [Clostridia bacterium]